MVEVVVAGHVCLDLIPALPRAQTPAAGTLVEVGAVRVQPGGAVFNTGSALAALGLGVRAVATIGGDPLGRVLTELVADAGMTADFATDPQRCTSYSIVVEDAELDRAFWHHVGTNQAFDGSEVNLAGADLLHVGYPTVLPGLVVDAGAPLVRLFQRAKADGVATSLDFSFADPEAAGRTDWRTILSRVLPHTDVVSPSIDDLTSMGVAADNSAAGVEAAARALVASGAAIALVSAGSRGAYLATGTAERLAACGGLGNGWSVAWADAAEWIDPTPVERVSSTTGAGDTLTAGLLYGLARGWDPRSAGAFAARLATARIEGRNLADLATDRLER